MKIKNFVIAASLFSFTSIALAAQPQTIKHPAKNATYKDYKCLVGCPIDVNQLILDRTQQNVGRAMPINCGKLLGFAGGINFDGHWGNRSVGYMGENTRRLSLNDAYLNVLGTLNDWTTAFVSISFSNFNTALVPALVPATGQRPGLYSSAYSTETAGAPPTGLAISGLNLEQGIIQFRNWQYSPFFVKLGKQFQDFGRYSIHPIERTMDQVLSETLRTSAEIGFLVPMGIHGDVYFFDNPMTEFGQAHTRYNYGVTLGWDHISDQLGWDFGAGYLYNMTGVNDVAYSVGVFNGTGIYGNYTNRVGASDIYGDINSGPFSLGVRYVTALQHFSMADLPNKAIAPTHGAKPWAAGIITAYAFHYWDRPQKLYFGYQGSFNAIELSLPRSRFIMGYNIEICKNTNLGIEWGHDKDYNATSGATGEASNTVGARAGVMFG